MDTKAPIKSVILTGNLIKNDLIYHLCPVTEFSEGVWNICIRSIAFDCTIENFSELCQISCNVVKSQKFTKKFLNIKQIL